MTADGGMPLDPNATFHGSLSRPIKQPDVEVDGVETADDSVASAAGDSSQSLYIKEFKKRLNGESQKPATS